MGLRVSIYRDDYNSPANLFQTKKQLTITNVEGPFEPTDDAPGARLQIGNLPGTLLVRPEDDAMEMFKNGIGPMMGGAYVATSDSRFTQKAEDLLGVRFYGAVALHDRFETVEQYRSMLD